MVIEYGLSTGESPNSISIEYNKVPTKEPHHCRFDDCLNPKKGYGDFCREHKAIGKIIAGKIAREKADSVDPSMSKYNEALRIQKSASTSVFVEEMMKIILGVAALFLFLYIFVVLPYRGFIDIIMGRA
tara:strand:- start:1727 stop:2113 length:387 start_codon:yes stop_codon:yes gene_type:complete